MSALMALMLPLYLACSPDEILKVTDPDIIDVDQARSPEGAEALRIGALARLNIATSGGESFFLLGGLLADEWRSGDTFTQRDETDKRSVQRSNANVNTAYRNVHRARATARQAVAALKEFAPDPAWRIGQMYAVQGFSETILGEHFCSGVPFSEVQGTVIDYGEPSTTIAVFERALAHYDSALANLAGPDSARVYRLAAVGKGRVLVNLGRYAEASAAVAAVPASFRFFMEHSISTRDNQIWALNNSARRWTVANRDGTNGVDFVAARDPRVPTCAGNDAVCRAQNPPITRSTSFDTRTAFVAQLVWPAREDSVVIVSGIEARLIIAESSLQAGQFASWLVELNQLRTNGTITVIPRPGDPTRSDTTFNAGTGGVAGLRLLTDPGTEAGRVDLMFRERAFWLFSTGHRLGDLRRLVRSKTPSAGELPGYGRAVESVFPTGAFNPGKGGTFGPDVNFPVTQAEDNNPKFKNATGRTVRGCLSDGA